MRVAPAGATEAELRDAPLRPRDRPAAGDRPHGDRPGRDDPLPARLEREHEGDQAAARGRRRPAAAAALARGDARPTAASAASSSGVDSSNAGTTRGLIRHEILPLLERLHPAARENILRALDERRTLPPALAELLDAPVASKRVDLGGGVQAVREHDRLWLERARSSSRARCDWGGWRIEAELPGLKVRGWRPGDRLAGRSKKIQDVFVDAKIPRSDREGWPLVVRGDEVVAVPGIVEAEGVRRCA